MKVLRALMIVLAISVSVYAGDMPCGKTGNIPADKAGDMPCDKASETITEMALQLLQSALPLF